MFNKRLKTLITCLALVSLNSNLAFADMINIEKPSSPSAPNTSTGSKIDIIKAQTTTTTTEVSSFDGNLHSTGKPDNGSKGVTIGAAYLTPKNKFGYMYVDKYDYDGSGTVKTYIDSWGGNVNSGASTSNNRLYENAKKYFVSAGGPARKAISDVSIDEYKKGAYNVQTSDSGRKFVASTMYVRYTYDIADGNVRNNKYETSNPILSSSYAGGPYIGMGDYFDETIDIITLGQAGKNKITSGGNKYFKSLSSLGINVPANSVPGLTIDDGFIKYGSSYQRPTKRAMLEKRFEYRRYIEEKTVTVDNPGGYEVVYPVTETTNKTQIVIPDISPKVSIKSKTEFTDNSKKEISRYVFDINIETKKTSKTYPESVKPYTVRKPSDIPANEPGETQMDFWHTDTAVYLDIIDSSGKSRLYNRKKITENDKTVYVLPSEIKPDASGSLSINGSTAKLIVEFKNNVRFMAEKDTYKYYYLQDGEKKTYSKVIEYIDKKPTGLQLKTEITNHWSSTDAREVLTYKTQTSQTHSVTASAGITAITDGDYVGVTMDVSVDPPNALTILEGGKFNVDMDINTNNVPIGTDGSDMWISDFKIEEVLVKSASDDVIYRDTNIPINPGTPTTIVKKQIQNLTAKPTHIGKATVTIKYSYVINTQRYRKEPIPGSGVQKPDGSMEWQYTTIKEPVEKTPQHGTAYDDFNIYSLSGTTVKAQDN